MDNKINKAFVLFSTVSVVNALCQTYNGSHGVDGDVKQWVSSETKGWGERGAMAYIGATAIFNSCRTST